MTKVAVRSAAHSAPFLDTLRSKALRFALLGATLLGASSALAADAAVWINKGIRDAIAQGKGEYVLPAGSFTLHTPIVIPDGTQNFSLRGQGSTVTTFRADALIGYAVLAGMQTIMWNNYPVNSMPTLAIGNVASGSTTLHVPNTKGLKVGDYLALWDEGYVQHWQNGDAQRNHEEIVRIATLTPGSTAVGLDRPVTRDYVLSPKVTSVTGKIVTGLTVQGMGFDASINGSGNRNNGLLGLGVSDNVNIADLNIQHFSTRALSMNWAENVTIDGVTIADGANAGNPGSAYGITICRSHNVTVKNCVSTDTRHGFVAHNGSTDVVFRNCQSLGDNGNFDTHGLDERRISFIDCFGSGALNLGNAAYLGGGSDFVVQNSTFGGSVLLSANVKRVRAMDSAFPGVLVQSHYGTTGLPTSGKSEDATFTNCRFDFTKSMLSEWGDFGTLKFNNCTFVTAPGVYGMIFYSHAASGNIVLQSCNLVDQITSAQYPPIRADIASPNYSLTMNDCKVYSVASAWAAVWFTQGFQGKATFNRNTYYSNSTRASFCLNDVGAAVQGGGNKCEPLKNGASLLAAAKRTGTPNP